jgi:hypothetical protein
LCDVNCGNAERRKISRDIFFNASQAPRQTAIINTITVNGRRSAAETKFIFSEFHSIEERRDDMRIKKLHKRMVFRRKLS